MMMRNHVIQSLREILHGLPALLALLAVAACAPPPIYKPDTSVVTTTPAQTAAAPDRYRNGEVIWGGSVVAVRNASDHSEIELLGLPLDTSQRPQPDQPATGRFIVLMPGYVESLDYPSGALLTVRGRIEGARAGKVGEADYTYPLVRVEQSHLWTPEELRKSRVHIGIGVGVIGGVH